MGRMKVILFGLLFISTIGEWLLYEDHISGFSLLFPSNYTIKEDSIHSDIGTTYTKTIAASTGEGAQSKIYMANFSSYPKEINLEDKDSTGYYLCQTIVDQISTQLEGGKVIYNNAVKINKMNARLVNIQYGEDSSMIRIAFLMHQNSLMSLEVYTPYEKGMSKEIERFFYSYQLIK